MRRRWARAHPENVRDNNYRRLYGLAFEQAEDLLRLQEGQCAICQKEIQFDGRKGAHVDHDHVSGVVRGVLCIACNVGVGQFQDDPHLLRRAISYLRKELHHGKGR